MNYNNPEEAWYHDLKQRPQGEGCLLSMLSVTFIALAIALMLSFSSCTTTKYVPVTHHTTDTLRITQHQRDSIWLHDSIHVTERADTIRIERWHTKYIEREVHDTIYQSKRDSIPMPYEVIKEVPRQKTLMENIVFCAGIIAFMCVILFIANKLKRFLP